MRKIKNWLAEYGPRLENVLFVVAVLLAFRSLLQFMAWVDAPAAFAEVSESDRSVVTQTALGASGSAALTPVVLTGNDECEPPDGLPDSADVYVFPHDSWLAHMPMYASPIMEPDYIDTGEKLSVYSGRDFDGYSCPLPAKASGTEGVALGDISVWVHYGYGAKNGVTRLIPMRNLRDQELKERAYPPELMDDRPLLVGARSKDAGVLPDSAQPFTLKSNYTGLMSAPVYLVTFRDVPAGWYLLVARYTSEEGVDQVKNVGFRVGKNKLVWPDD